MSEFQLGSRNMFTLLDDESASPREAASAKGAPNKKDQSRIAPAPLSSGAAAAAAPAAAPAARANKAGGADRKHGGFDRRSGTGRGGPRAGSDNKRQGGGRFNWGDGQAVPEEAAGDSKAEGDAPAADGDAAAAPEAQAEEEEDNTVSYDQYLKSLASKRVDDDAKLQIRAVVEDNKNFKKSVVLEKEEEEPLFADLVQVKEKKIREKKTKAIVNLEEFAPKAGSGGGERGGFRGGRGGRGGFRGDSNGERGGFRGGRGGFRGDSNGDREPRGDRPDRPSRGGFRGDSSAERGRGGYRGDRGGRGRADGAAAGAPRGGSSGPAKPVINNDDFPALGSK